MSLDDVKNSILQKRTEEWTEELEGWTKKEASKLGKAVDQAHADVMQRIASFHDASPEWTVQRTNRLLGELTGMTEGVRNRLAGGVADIATVAGVQSLAQHSDILSFGGRVQGFNMASLSPAQVRSLVVDTPLGGKLLQEWVDDTFSHQLQGGIRREIAAGMLQGESYRQLTNRLDLKFRKLADTSTEVLARTYVQSVNVGAMESVYRANPRIVKKVRWSAALEVSPIPGRGTCISCAVLDGRTYNLDNHPLCPQHPLCRCVLLPVTASYRELGLDMDEVKKSYRPYVTRGITGEVEKVGTYKGTFSQLFNAKGKQFKRMVVGPSRYELIENGLVKFDDLVDHATGRLKLLSELPRPVKAEAKISAAQARAKAKRRAAALKNKKTINKKHRKIADEMEEKVAEGIGGDWIIGNRPFDVMLDNEFIEVKTVLQNDSGLKHQIWMDSDAIKRKAQFQKTYGVRGHTVAIEMTPGSPNYGQLYYRQGFRKYTLNSMEPVTMEELQVRLLHKAKKKEIRDLYDDVPKFANKEDVTKWSKLHLAPEVDYSGISKEMAEEFARYAKPALREYGIRPTAIRFSDEFFQTAKMRHYPAYALEDGQIFFNPRFFKTRAQLRKFADEQFNINQFTTNSGGHVFRHEISHLKYFQLGGTEASAERALSAAYKKELYKNIGRANLPDYISKYALTSEGEFYAEMLAREMAGLQIHPVARKIMKNIENKLRRGVAKKATKTELTGVFAKTGKKANYQIIKDMMDEGFSYNEMMAHFREVFIGTKQYVDDAWLDKRLLSLGRHLRWKFGDNYDLVSYKKLYLDTRRPLDIPLQAARKITKKTTKKVAEEKKMIFKSKEHNALYEKEYNDFLTKAKELELELGKAEAITAIESLGRDLIGEMHIRQYLSAWQTSAQSRYALALKFMARKLENKPLGKVLFRDYNEWLTKASGNVKHALRSMVPEEYIKIRAYNQAYFEFTGQKTIKLWRGTDGRTAGPKYREVVLQAMKENPDRTKWNKVYIEMDESPLMGYSMEKKMADDFGAWHGGVTETYIAPVDEVFLHHALWPKTGYVYESECLLHGYTKRRVFLDNLDIGTLTDEMKEELGLIKKGTVKKSKKLYKPKQIVAEPLEESFDSYKYKLDTLQMLDDALHDLGDEDFQKFINDLIEQMHDGKIIASPYIETPTNALKLDSFMDSLETFYKHKQQEFIEGGGEEFITEWQIHWIKPDALEDAVSAAKGASKAGANASPSGVYEIEAVLPPPDYNPTTYKNLVTNALNEMTYEMSAKELENFYTHLGKYIDNGYAPASAFIEVPTSAPMLKDFMDATSDFFVKNYSLKPWQGSSELNVLLEEVAHKQMKSPTLNVSSKVHTITSPEVLLDDLAWSKSVVDDAKATVEQWMDDYIDIFGQEKMETVYFEAIDSVNSGTGLKLGALEIPDAHTVNEVLKTIHERLFVSGYEPPPSLLGF